MLTRARPFRGDDILPVVPGDATGLMTDIAALQRAVRDETIYSDGAWEPGLDVDGFLRRVTAGMNRRPLVVVEHAEFDHYGSGYSSYVSISITKRDGSVRHERANGWVDVECLEIALCRLAPLACLLRPATRSRGPNGAGAYSLPQVGRLVTIPDQRWEGEYRQIADVLAWHDLPLVGPNPLADPLPDGLRVETNLADSAQTIFDAWFHWRD